MWFFLWIEKKIKGDRFDEPFKPPSFAKEVLYVCGVVFTYAMMMLMSILVQVLDWQVELITLMITFILAFTVCVAVSCMLLRQIIRPVVAVEPAPADQSKTAHQMSVKVAPEADNEGYIPDITDKIPPKHQDSELANDP